MPFYQPNPLAPTFALTLKDTNTAYPPTTLAEALAHGKAASGGFYIDDSTTGELLVEYSVVQNQRIQMYICPALDNRSL